MPSQPFVRLIAVGSVLVGATLLKAQVQTPAASPGPRPAQAGPRLSESVGVTQYFNNCASCHEGSDPEHQAPRTAVLKQMTPEHIYESLTTGTMRTNAENLSDADKRLIAEWLARTQDRPGQRRCRRAHAERLRRASARARS